MQPSIELIKQYLLVLQDQISDTLQLIDPDIALVEENWTRPEGGGGRTRAFRTGKIFEKAGINFSHVWGNQLPKSATTHRQALNDEPFEALGISLIIHPVNPFVPTCHANLRFFISSPHQKKPVWWFGGGFDLTPYYGFEEDCLHWHAIAKQACDPFGPDIYKKYKRWADEYFYIKHRNEPRGIGGLFFDDLNQWEFSTCFQFIQSVGNHFSSAYFPLVERRKDMPYSAKERAFQCYRRGRYVEFNLVYDRGTLFGLESGGRIESILISLPPLVSWEYGFQPLPGSQEAELYEKYLQPRDWVTEAKEEVDE